MARLGYLQLTRACVQSCRFCSNPPTGVDLGPDEMRAAIDDLAERGYDGVVLTGGEPTISPLLTDALDHAAARGLACRVITNGQRLADRGFFESCVAHGLRHLHLSLHAHRADVHDDVARHPGSFGRALDCLRHAGELGVAVDVNAVISSWNAPFLDELAAWIVDRHPRVRHVVWNGLDVHNARVEAHPEAIARVADYRVTLDRALAILDGGGRTFRVERVPLCAMRAWAWASTETRKIVKGEGRIVRFLDEKGLVVQEDFRRDKGAACSACRWDAICAGAHALGRAVDERELVPVFDDPEPIVRRVRTGGG